MNAPRIDQLNVVVGDVAAAARFLVELGVDIPAVDADWGGHHRAVPVADGTTLDLDSGVFAQQWGRLDASFRGVVVNVRVDERPDVDRLHEQALALGARSLKPPYDAFWGARFATVEAPGELVVGIMSASDEAHRGAPPDPATLG